MSKVELTFFKFKGQGEQIRLLLAYGGQEFTDTRITSEEWEVLKHKAPFKQIPFLHIDGKPYSQSTAIARYLGRKYGLNGSNIEEDFEIDQNLDFLAEIRQHGGQVVREPTEELKNKRHEEKSKLYPDYMKKLDEIIRANNGHMACGKLTWADLVFAGQYDLLKWLMRNPDLDNQYPSFRKLYDDVRAHPKLQKYIATAPNPDY